MRDTFLKRTEILFRRLLIRALRYVYKRKNDPDSSGDYNSCKFLFIRQDRIGDVLVSIPSIHLLKKKYPGASIDFILSENNYFVLDNDPVINRKWIYRKNILKIVNMIVSLRKQHYDYAVDLIDNSSATSTLLCLMAGAKHNVGLQKENSYVYDIVVPMPSRKDTHIVDRISRLLAPFNIDAGNETLEIKYTVSEESRAFADDFISSSNIQNKPVIGINISAGGKSRYLGTENYRRLISYIISKYPSVPVVILFKPSDAGRAKNITDGFNRVLLSPMTEKFDQFAAIIERMALIISPDTSVVHLVSAFKIPSVIMYVQSDLNLNIWEPYNVECETLVTDVDDLSTIPVDRIITSFDNMIGYALDRHKERNPGGLV